MPFSGPTVLLLAPYTQNLDDTFLGMKPLINDKNDENTDTDQKRTDGEGSVTTLSQSRSPSGHPVDDDSVDVFDEYLFKVGV